SRHELALQPDENTTEQHIAKNHPGKVEVHVELPGQGNDLIEGYRVSVDQLVEYHGAAGIAIRFAQHRNRVDQRGEQGRTVVELSLEGVDQIGGHLRARRVYLHELDDAL